MNIHQKEIFFSNHRITIHSLLTYSVCDKEVKNSNECDCKRIFSCLLRKMRKQYGVEGTREKRPPRGSNQHSKLLFYNKNKYNILRSHY